jgi:hypothetical protein
VVVLVVGQLITPTLFSGILTLGTTSAGLACEIDDEGPLGSPHLSEEALFSRVRRDEVGLALGLWSDEGL